jgi:hypothetical protein
VSLFNARSIAAFNVARVIFSTRASDTNDTNIDKPMHRIAIDRASTFVAFIAYDQQRLFIDQTHSNMFGCKVSIQLVSSRCFTACWDTAQYYQWHAQCVVLAVAIRWRDWMLIEEGRANRLSSSSSSSSSIPRHHRVITWYLAAGGLSLVTCNTRGSYETYTRA